MRLRDDAVFKKGGIYQAFGSGQGNAQTPPWVGKTGTAAKCPHLETT